MIRWLISRLLLLCLLLGCAWFVVFVWFLTRIPPEAETTISALPSADAIVVLTGGSGRLEHALELMEYNKSRWMFVSGVNIQAKKDEIFDFAIQGHSVHYQKYKNQIALGFDAVNTVTNAQESYEWAEKQGVKTMLLVTSDYHMPRALYEFEKENDKGFQITPAPSDSGLLDFGAVIKSPMSLLLVINEFHKYVVTYLEQYIPMKKYIAMAKSWR